MIKREGARPSLYAHQEVKMVIKGMVKTMVATPIAGATLNMIGSTNLSGLGPATQSLVAAGYLGSVAKMAKIKGKKKKYF